jgi:hypothetical protein
MFPEEDALSFGQVRERLSEKRGWIEGFLEDALRRTSACL